MATVPVTVWAGSWNVNGKRPATTEQLDDWLCPPIVNNNNSNTANTTSSSPNSASSGANFTLSPYSSGGDPSSPSPSANSSSSSSTSSSSIARPADIVAMGFQEVVDLSAKNLLVDPHATGRWEALTEDSLRRALGRFASQEARVGRPRPGADGYVMIASTHLVGLALCVWVRTSLLHKVRAVRTGKVGIGLMGVGGNKGAIGVSFTVNDTSVCFLNAHIAAHQEKVQARNAHYSAIMRRLRFDSTTGVSPRVLQSQAQALPSQAGRRSGLDDDDDGYNYASGGGGGAGGFYSACSAPLTALYQQGSGGGGGSGGGSGGSGSGGYGGQNVPLHVTDHRYAVISLLSKIRF